MWLLARYNLRLGRFHHFEIMNINIKPSTVHTLKIIFLETGNLVTSLKKQMSNLILVLSKTEFH